MFSRSIWARGDRQFSYAKPAEEGPHFFLAHDVAAFNLRQALFDRAPCIRIKFDGLVPPCHQIEKQLGRFILLGFRQFPKLFDDLLQQLRHYRLLSRSAYQPYSADA
jgi:hypothetical protein